jgi:hypothetical protein
MDRKYKLTFMSAMKWAEHELEHVGRIVAVEDPDIQYSYAMSTLYGILHLKKALSELLNDPAYSSQREDIQRTHDKVNRTLKHLIKDFSLDLNVIQAFNTKKILGDLANIRPVTPLPGLTLPNATRPNATRPNATRPNATRPNATRNTRNNRSSVNTTRTNKKNGFLSLFGL